ASFSLAIRTANRIFLCHSVPSASRLDGFELAHLQQPETRPENFTSRGSVHSLVWGRDTRADTVADFLKKVDADLAIIGHIPCPEGYAVANSQLLILDCQKAPACYCLFPTDRPLTMPDLEKCVGKLVSRPET